MEVEKTINKLNPDKHYLVAVSGGVDSMVLVYAMNKFRFHFSVAHVNFNLRGEESDGDEIFVKEWCTEHGIPFFSKSVDTETFCEEYKFSIQEGARKLRYDWFEELMSQYGFDYLLTGHHLNDSVETFFINFLRGTGVNGLKGIPAQNGYILRPLIYVTQADIISYANKNKISYREDSSNTSVKYLRNAIRQNLIPEMEKLTNFYPKARQNFILLEKQTAFYAQAIAKELSTFWVKSPDCLELKWVELKKQEYPDLLLAEALLPLGFSSSQLEDMLLAETGATFFSANHKLTFNAKGNLVIYPNESKEQFFCEIYPESEIESPIKLKAVYVSKLPDSFHSKEIYIDADKLSFPLIYRKMREGDWFVPFGMQGKKKLSDFFTDLKIDRFAREQARVLLSGEDIIWVVGYRADNRFKINEKTRRILKLSID